MPLILSLLAGAILPLGLSPLELWPLTLISPGILAWLCFQKSGWQLWRIVFSYGLGLFGVGASWVFVSINDFGNTSLTLALIMTGLFVGFLALAFTLPFLVTAFHSAFQSQHWKIHCISFIALWCFGEWSRTWLFTGFPWLFVGYSHITTPLSGYAPVLGVLGVGLTSITVSVLLATLLREFLNHRKYTRAMITPALSIIALIGIGALLSLKDWTHPISSKSESESESTVTQLDVAMAQGNIPQMSKWDPLFLQETIHRYQSLSEDHWNADLIIWPEAAIPLLYTQAVPLLDQIQAQANETNTVFVTGILLDNRTHLRPQYFNSLLTLDTERTMQEQWFHKTRLVPFGEYVPLEEWLRGLIAFFNLPTSIINIGPDDQSNPIVKTIEMAVAICYEIAYPALVAERAKTSGFIVTVSNDGWFGNSWGPLQHFQMAQMRALENQRPLLRSTNNGVTASVDHTGQIIDIAPRFVQASLRTQIDPRVGTTPYQRWKDWPVIILCFAGLLLARHSGKQSSLSQ